MKHIEGRKLCQPRNAGSQQTAHLSGTGSMATKILRVLTLAVGIIAIGAMPAFAHDIALTADCTGYTISASNFDTATVIYTITLTPSSGSSITVGPLTVSNNGSDTETWGVTLNGDYTL